MSTFTTRFLGQAWVSGSHTLLIVVTVWCCVSLGACGPGSPNIGPWFHFIWALCQLFILGLRISVTFAWHYSSALAGEILTHAKGRMTQPFQEFYSRLHGPYLDCCLLIPSQARPLALCVQMQPEHQFFGSLMFGYCALCQVDTELFM